LNELNFASMKHRVLSHYEHMNRRSGPAARGSDIPNAHRLFFWEAMRSMGPTPSMFLRRRYQSDFYRSPERHLPRSSPDPSPRKRDRLALPPNAARCWARGCRGVVFRSNRHGAPLPHVHHAPDRSVPGVARHHDPVSIRRTLRDRETQTRWI
jgi:hypothetical protein